MNNVGDTIKTRIHLSIETSIPKGTVGKIVINDFPYVGVRFNEDKYNPSLVWIEQNNRNWWRLSSDEIESCISLNDWINK